MRRGWRAFVTALLFSGLTVVSLALPTVSPQTVDALMQEIDEEVPPGNPVIGDDRPGDVPDGDDTNYAGWALVAVCLIVAGLLLVRIERWESRRRERAEDLGS